MRKLFSYIIITIFFFGTTGLSQLFKLPVLIAHFMEHRERDNGIDMLDFLSMHYWGQDLNDNDEDRDMQLPFKNVEQNLIAQVIISPVQQISIAKPELPVRSVQPVNSDEHHIDPALNSLFRPPRA